MGAYDRNDRRREQQGIVPDLKVCLNPERICELKGIRSDSTHTNYNGAEVTGVAKRELTIPVEVVRQAIKLDERVRMDAKDGRRVETARTDGRTGQDGRWEAKGGKAVWEVTACVLKAIMSNFGYS